ncbi:MAG: hypothetical protein M3336_00980 [Chloroflexota bacterium]|nr:hypothetical protein [Chloroflexota bacterium]
MAERLLANEADLERALVDLGRRVAYPPTPDLELAIRRRLAQMPPPRRRPGWWYPAPWPRALAVALLALLVLFGASVAISPQARQVIAERLGLRGVTVEHVPDVPTPTPTNTPEPTRQAAPTPTPAAPGAALGLGERQTLEQARSRASFTLLLPTDIGPPDAVYVASMNQVSLVYGPRAELPPAPLSPGVGLLITEFRAALDETLMGKGVPPNTRLEEVRVGATRGFFISGGPHVVYVRDPSGQIREERSRLAGNTLLFEHNGITVRVESALDRDAAIRLALSLR